MKRLIYAAMATLTLLTGCGETGSAPEKIPGTYVTAFEHATAIVQDTIFIRPFSKRASEGYAIERRTGLQPVRKGKVMPRQNKVQHWTGHYDQQNNVLKVQPNGRLLYPDLERLTLRMGWTVYRKIKN